MYVKIIIYYNIQSLIFLSYIYYNITKHMRNKNRISNIRFFKNFIYYNIIKRIYEI